MSADVAHASDRADKGRSAAPAWALAAFVAVLLHAGAAGCVALSLHAGEDDPELGAQAIAIGLDMSAPWTEPSDLPPGPEAADAAASTAQVEQKAKVEDSVLPKEQPVESPDPDRVVAPDAAKMPKDEEPKVTAQAAATSAESVASEAAAPPPSETAPVAPQSLAPAIGIGDSARRVTATWQRELVAHLDRHKRYPAGTPPRTAEILVGFTIDRTGHVLRSEVVRSSGNRAFDDAALAMMRRSDPVPAPPPLVADESLSFTVPVRFRAKDARS